MDKPNTTFEQYVESKILLKRKENFYECIRQAKLEDKDLISKIENKFINNPDINMFKPHELVELIAKYKPDNPDVKYLSFIISAFAKDPVRQGIHEKEAIDWIKAYPKIKNVNKPTNPELYLKDGQVLERISGKRSNKEASKSVDVKFSINDTVFLATIKYTKDEGGHQDNQFRDVIDYLKQGIGVEKYIIVALVDGKYFSDKRINELRNVNANAIVLRLSELDRLIKMYI